MVAFENPLLTGLKITTVIEHTQFRTISTEYFKAGFERLDQALIHPKRTVYSTHVRDLAHARLLIWHGVEPEYIVLRTDPPPAEPKLAIGAPELIITTETTDTGERKIFFGQLTRHLIMEEKRCWVSDSRRGLTARPGSTAGMWMPRSCPPRSSIRP